MRKREVQTVKNQSTEQACLGFIVAIFMASANLVVAQDKASPIQNTADVNGTTQIKTAENTLRDILIGIFARDLAVLSENSIPNKDLKVLVEGNQSTVEQLAAWKKFVRDLEIRRLKIGDEVLIDGKTKAVMDANRINENRVQLTFLNNPQTPFEMVFASGRWLVNPETSIAAAKAARATQNQDNKVLTLK
jgi:hypothetical protein